jgi:chemotaxis protein methyltransferase CheR
VINSSGPKLRLVDDLRNPYKKPETSQQSMQSVEKEHILRVLEQTEWKISGKDSAAEILGLDRSTLRARMRKLDIEK